jgi:small-conductance mechanosensitive channel
MTTTHKVASAVLTVILAATIYGVVRTGRDDGSAALQKSKIVALAEGPVVDQSELETAQKLAQLADKPEEQALSKEAIRLVDHELDLAFEAARREIAAHPPALSAKAQEIEARLDKAQSLQKTDQALVEQLTAAEAKSSGSAKETLDDRLEEAKARLESDEDEVDDATQDLNRAGGDVKARLEKLDQEHKAASAAVDNGVQKYPEAVPDQFGLVHQYTQWSRLHQKQLALAKAGQAAETAATALSSRHNALDAKIEVAKQASPDLAGHGKKAAAAGDAGTAVKPGDGAVAGAGKNRSHEESSAAVARMKQIVADEKGLPNLDRRADYQRQLAAVYAEWSERVSERQRAVLHSALQGLLIIIAIGLVGVFFEGWLEKLLGKTKLDRRQVETLRTVTRVSVQVAAVLLILLVILGLPGQLGTFLGLAGAGLTVALKDFIVGFMGWFVLMRKNGIRLGDWVEINGVTGEVVELGMFHTVLLETGNWTDSSHPTGRRVTFTNSFAIEGHYFNFSTSGQWLWDELQVVLPPGQDFYPMMDAIQKQVQEATSDSAKQAETEWRGATGSREMGAISVAPAISVKPVVGGIEVAVRYITRANERYELRSKLYQAIVKMLGGKALAAVSTGPEPAPGPADSGSERLRAETKPPTK